MLTISIPGSNTLTLDHLVLDYNGTIAEDGNIIPKVVGRIIDLSETLDIYIVTADTYGTVAEKTKNLPCTLEVIPPTEQDQAKKQFIQQLGSNRACAIGNGRNDALMLTHAALGIGIIQAEGGCSKMLYNADVICTHINDALDLLLLPDRLKATLRN